MKSAVIAMFIGSLMLAAVPAVAESADLFGGYQLTHFDGGPNFNGWNAALTGNFARHFGVTGDFSGVYNSGLKFHSYTFGPEVHTHSESVKLFAHALFGGATASGGGASTSGFVMYYGGGMDVKVQKHLAVRLGQFDWMVARFNGVTDKNNFRYSGGVVFHF